MIDKSKSKGVISSWAVHRLPDPYQPPEAGRVIVGWFQGGWIQTSNVVEAEGRFVRTAVDSVYCLGPICRKYRKWIKDSGLLYDAKAPVKILSKAPSGQGGES